MHLLENRARLLSLAIALAAVLVVAGGCGGGSGSGSGGTTGTAGSSEPGGASSGTGSGLAGSLVGARDLVLRIGRIPFTNPTDMVRKHEALMNYLQAELGIKEARLILAKDYSGILDKLQAGDIDVAWLGTVPYVEGRDRFKLKPLVKPVRFGSDVYRGLIITRQDSGIKRLDDLKGKRFAWVEKESASGYLFPKALLISAGVNPAADFSEAAFLYKHDAVVLNVLLGKFDAGACYDDARKTLPDKEKINELTILATTEDIANEPIVCREDMAPDLQKAIKESLLKLNIEDPKYRKVMQDCTDVQHFVPASDADYDSARKLLTIIRGSSAGTGS